MIKVRCANHRFWCTNPKTIKFWEVMAARHSVGGSGGRPIVEIISRR